MLVATTSQLHFSEQFSSIDAISLLITNVLEILACSRLSDSGEGAKEWERCVSAFSIRRISSRSLEQAIKIRSSLAAYEEITGGFEPNRSEEILWINNETDYDIHWDVQYVVLGPDEKDVNEYFLS